MIKAVIFDLDDTLYQEIEYVKSGFKAVAEAMDDLLVYDRLWSLFQKNKKDVYQRAGFTDEQCKKCISVYRSHMPDIQLPNETLTTLQFLRSKEIKLGIITDGRPVGQRNKIEALGLEDKVDEIIVTDEMGGIDFRKPDRHSFEIMRQRMDVDFCEMMYVGDNPEKDFYIGSIYPIHTVRIMNGIYENKKYFKGIKEIDRIKTIKDVIELI